MIPVSSVLAERLTAFHSAESFKATNEKLACTIFLCVLFTVLGAVAELERNLIRERVHMGISWARKEGKRLGRPKRIFDREKARTMLETMSLREAARQLGVSRGVVERALSSPGR